MGTGAFETARDFVSELARSASNAVWPAIEEVITVVGFCLLAIVFILVAGKIAPLLLLGLLVRLISAEGAVSPSRSLMERRGREILCPRPEPGVRS